MLYSFLRPVLTLFDAFARRLRSTSAKNRCVHTAVSIILVVTLLDNAAHIVPLFHGSKRVS